jgi:outer membrane protein assembly factor BamB
VEHVQVAEIAALAGALGAVLALIPRGGILPLVGLGLLGVATGGLAWSLIGDNDLELLLQEPTGIALVVVGIVGAIACAVPLARNPAVVPVALLAVAPFRVPIQLGNEEAFLLLPLYLVIAATVLALAYRVVRGERPAPPPLFLALPVAALVLFAGSSFLWTWDERSGGIALAFFVFPFVAAFATVARAPVASWLPRALLVTLVALGSLFAVVGIWQAHTRTVFFARDVEVANAYTSFFRVTSLFKDPSLYGRYLVVPIAVLLVAILIRRGRTVDWVLASLFVAFLFWGLFYSYSQSSFVALFVVTFGVALVGAGRRVRIVLIACAIVAALAAGAVAAEAVGGRSARDVTSGRSRLVSVTLQAFRERPIAGVGVGGQPHASAEIVGKGSPSRNASHTTPFTLLAELGVIGFGLYLWLLAAAAWALVSVSRLDRSFGIGLAAVLLALVVHSLLYAGFFEDPVTWGVLGLTAAVLAPGIAARDAPSTAEGRLPLLAHWRRAGSTGPLRMPRAFKWIIAAVAVLVAALGGLAIGIALTKQERPSGSLDTDLEGVTVSAEATTEPEVAPTPEQVGDRACWRTFGADPRRSLARPDAALGLPARKYVWTRGLESYIEFPPVYCEGDLYVNAFKGTTYAIDAETGRIQWQRRVGGTLPSSPAIDGPRVLVASQDGTVTALSRSSGSRVWQVRTAGKVESSPVVVDGTAFFGSHDGRVFAVRSDTGHILWAYQTGGRINASPSVFGGQVCVTTYAGSFVCLDRRTGVERWTTYLKRDAFRYESFYASPSSDGDRLYSVARSGKVAALDASSGRVVWTADVGGLGYTTPAVADGRIFAGGFDGRLRAFRAIDGEELWSTWVGGRILGAPVVIGPYVFFSTLEKRTYAVRVSDGSVAWRLPLGRYSPGIATERTYFFSLNGRLLAVHGRDAPTSR